MKKLLLISYFYPLCNLKAAKRVQGWANYLLENWYYPIANTPQWDTHIDHPGDLLSYRGEVVKIEQNRTHEALYFQT